MDWGVRGLQGGQRVRARVVAVRCNVAVTTAIAVLPRFAPCSIGSSLLGYVHVCLSFLGKPPNDGQVPDLKSPNLDAIAGLSSLFTRSLRSGTITQPVAGTRRLG